MVNKGYNSLTTTALAGNIQSISAVFISKDSRWDSLGSDFFGLCLDGLTSLGMVFTIIVRQIRKMYKSRRP